MTVPDEFKIACRRIFQDAFEVFPSIEEIIRFALAPLDDKQSQGLKAFLDELLSGRHDGEELQRIWWEGDADLYFPDAEHLMMFLRTMRDMLNGEPSQTRD